MDQTKADAIQHIMGTLFSAQNALRSLAPEYKWAGMGNLLGDYGECVAINHFGWSKAPAGASGYDAIDKEGRRVQIKTNHASSSIGFRGEADRMLVLHVAADGTWEVLYLGDFTPVAEASNYSARDNKRTITITRLKALAGLQSNAELELRLSP